MFDVDRSWELALCIRNTVREEAMLMCARMAMIDELLNRRIAEVADDDDDDLGYMLVIGFSRTVAEVGAAMHLSPRDASHAVSQAESLTNRLPKVAHVLGRGHRPDQRGDHRTRSTAAGPAKAAGPRWLPLGTPEVEDAIKGLSPDRFRAVLDLLLVATVAPVVGRGAHVFDPDRVTVEWT